MSNCPICKSDSKDLRNGFSICKQCGNVYVPVNEIPREYLPKISTTFEETYSTEDKRLLAELIYNFLIEALKDNKNTMFDIENIANVLSRKLQKKFEIKKKEILND